jgi:hypothetical protein
MASLGINVTEKGPVRCCVHGAQNQSRQLLLFGLCQYTTPTPRGCVLASWSRAGHVHILGQGKDRRNHLTPSSSQLSLYDDSSLRDSQSYRGCIEIWPT